MFLIVGVGLQYLHDEEVYFGMFSNNQMNGEGFIQRQNKSCASVKMFQDKELESLALDVSPRECFYLIYGKRIVKENESGYIDCEEEDDDDNGGDYSDEQYEDDNYSDEHDGDYSDEHYGDYSDEHYGDYSDSVINENELFGITMNKPTLVKIEYNLTYCQELHGKYCNNATSYEGEISQGFKSGFGMQEFSSGSFFYGSFSYDYMHGDGVLMLEHEEQYMSGKMHFDTFDFGIRFDVKKKTAVVNKKNKKNARELALEYEVENGKLSCKEYDNYEVKTSECNKNTISENQLNGIMFEGDAPGIAIQQDFNDRYIGQFDRKRKRHGMGYLWKEFTPIYIGTFTRNRYDLHGHGMRIQHSGGKPIGISIGRWYEGKALGAGIAISSNDVTVGYFSAKSTADDNKWKRLIRHIEKDNTQSFKTLVIKDPRENI